MVKKSPCILKMKQKNIYLIGVLPNGNSEWLTKNQNKRVGT